MVMFLILAFFASFVSSSLGIGSGVIMLGVGALFMDFKLLVLLATFQFLITTTIKAVLYRSHIKWDLAWLSMSASIPLMLLGAYLLLYLESALLMKFLGAMLLLYVVNTYFDWAKNIHVNKLWIWIISGVAGFTGGLVGDSTPVRAPLFDHLGLRKEVFIGTLAFMNMVGNVVKIPVYAQLVDDITLYIPLVLGLVLVCFIGAWCGRRVLQNLSMTQFRSGLMFMFAILGFKLLLF